jgi:3-oxoacyl-(acyl-carrier-protein) synthase
VSAGLGGVGVVTGWGPGLAAVPDDARRAAAGRRVITAATSALDGERFRRATRECLLAVEAVRAAVEAAGLARDQVAGPATALVYVTAAAYGASNRGFIDDERRAAGALHFPYTAPSAVPAEAAIEFALTGPYMIFVGDDAAARDAVWYAGRLLDDGAAARALVLGVETYAECEDLWARGRWLAGRPLTEAAACVLLAREGRPLPATAEWRRLEAEVERRAGRTLACRPLIALALTEAGRAAAAG